MVLPQANFSEEQETVPSEFPKIITIEIVPFLLEQKRKELSQAHKDVLAFFDEAHTPEETMEWEKYIRQRQRELVTIRDILDANPDVVSEKLFTTHDYMMREARIIAGDLLEDRKGLEKKKKESEFDLFKLLSYGVVLPSIAHSHLRARYPDNPLIANIGFTGIFLVGVGFHLRSHIKQAWEIAKKDITPQDIKISVGFMAYYAKHSVLVTSQNMGKQAAAVVMKMNPMRRQKNKNMKKEIKNDLS